MKANDNRKAQLQEVQQPEVIFLKIKVSTPNKPNSTIFEKLDSCILSLAVTQRGLDVVIKFKNVRLDEVQSVIQKYHLDDIVEVVNATTFFEIPLVYSSYQKDIGLYCIQCKDKVEQVTRNLISYGAIQVFLTNDEYNIWSLFAFDKIAYFNEMMKQRLFREFPDVINDSTLYSVLEVRKSTEGARIGGLATDIDSILADTRCGKGYWPALLNIVRLLLFRPRTKKSMATQLGISIKHVERCLGILRQRGTIRIVGREGEGAVYDLNNEKFQSLFIYLRE